MHQSKHKLLLPIRLLLFCLLGLQELLLADAEISRQNVENRATSASSRIGSMASPVQHLTPVVSHFRS